MLRHFGVVVAGCAMTLYATPAVAAELTPDGPATLMNRPGETQTLEGTPPIVIVGARVVVGEGGREGTIRVRARRRSEPSRVGEPVLLPATPGTYTFSAPRVGGDYRELRIGIDQEVGGHAIVGRQTCAPEMNRKDLCALPFLDVLTGDPDGTPAERRDTPLAITAITETDLDQDLLGDRTEDRTDLQAGAGPTTRGADGRLRTPVTITNRGPLQADVPLFETTSDAEGLDPVALVRADRDGWESGCVHRALMFRPGKDLCVTVPLAVGASRTHTFISAGPAEIAVGAEGPDLAPADNVVRVTGVTPVEQTQPQPQARLSLKVAQRQRLRDGLKVHVAGRGRVRVTAAFKVRGKTIRLARTVTAGKTVTLKAKGAKLRTLRRAVERGPVRAVVTVRDAAGNVRTTKVTVR